MSTHKAPIVLAIFLAASLLSLSASAKKGDITQAIDVSADRSEYDEQKGIQSLIGNVEIKQGTMVIKASKIEIYLKNNRLSKIEGVGNPIIFEQMNEADELVSGRADSISYDASNGTLILMGNATLSQPRQQLKSQRIVFDSTKQKVSAEGGDNGRVSIRIEAPPVSDDGN
ncbi:MAG: lipopolysaccharide transport periplasmic protein LptA [Granulosicoccaceae bacterium]